MSLAATRSMVGASGAVVSPAAAAGAAAAAATLTVNVTGARSNLPPVSLLTWVAEIVTGVLPVAFSPVTLRSFTSPQLVKMTSAGLTVARSVLLDLSASLSVVLPVRLQPFFPSSLVVSTLSCVVPAAPPAVSDMASAVASIEGSSVL